MRTGDGRPSAAWVALAARDTSVPEATGRTGAGAAVIEVEAHARCGTQGGPYRPLAKGQRCLRRHLATGGAAMNSAHRHVPVNNVPRQLWRHGTNAAETLVI